MKNDSNKICCGPMMSEKMKKYHLKRLLAVDFGVKTTGIAQFTPGDFPFPIPYTTLQFQSDKLLSKDILKISADESIDYIIVGLPHLLDGQATDMTKRVMDFAQTLKQISPSIPILLQDETLSTFEAQKRMKESPQYNFQVDKSQLDAVAASIILENFMNCEEEVFL